MKYLIWVLLAVLVWMWLRWRRQNRRTDAAAKSAAPAQPQAMIQCPVCGFHLPRNEAFIGQSGAYCSEDHRARHEG